METTKIALEDEISRVIMSDNGCTAHFNYSDDSKNGKGSFLNPSRIITVETYNPKTNESFLLKQVCAETDEKGLLEIVEYVKTHKVDYNTYAVVSWAKKDGGKQPVSHFYCKDALEALETFYFNKKREDYIIYSVEMRPKS